MALISLTHGLNRTGQEGVVALAQATHQGMAHNAPVPVIATSAGVSAYDLSRDIVQELQDCGEPVVDAVVNEEGEIDEINFTQDAIRVIERMIRAALQSEGISS